MIELKLNGLFERFRGVLPKGVLEEGIELVAHGECGVAHELLSQMLLEYSVPLQSSDLTDLQESASLSGLDPRSLEFLRPLVQPEQK